MSYFKEGPPKPGGCFTCTHFHGEVTGGGRHPVCNRVARPLVMGQPDIGCCSWEREPGADDELPTPEQRGLVDTVVARGQR